MPEALIISWLGRHVVFSRYYDELGSTNRLVDCGLKGTAIYAASELYDRWAGSAQCVSGTVPATLAPITWVATSTAGPGQLTDGHAGGIHNLADVRCRNIDC